MFDIKVSSLIYPWWGAVDAKIKSHVESAELKGSRFKTWSRSIEPYMLILLCLLPGIPSLLIFTLLVHSSAYISKTSAKFFLCWLWLTPVPLCHRIKEVTLLIDTDSWCFSGFVFQNCGYNLSFGLRKSCGDLWNEEVGDRLKFVFSPDIILCGWPGWNSESTS